MPKKADLRIKMQRNGRASSTPHQIRTAKKRANLPDLTFYITTKMAYGIREDVIRLKNSFLG